MAEGNGNGNGDRSEKIAAWAREHGNEFRGQEVADFLGVEAQAVGPTLRSMVNAGTLYKTTKDGKTAYGANPVEQEAQPEFIVNLKQSLTDRLAVLDAERSKLDEKLQAIDAEADKIIAAFPILNAA